MKKPAVRYALAFLITIASAIWQRISGPTYPVRGNVTLGGQEIRLKLTRTHGGEGDQPVTVAAPDALIRGAVAWRRFPTSEDWSFRPMSRSGDTLEAALPHQPPAGKLEYQVRLDRGAETQLFPPRPAVTRFKGDVPTSLLVTHVAVMFSGMLVSSAAGLSALVPGLPLRKRTLLTLSLIVLGGFVLGPMVQKAAFGAWWTGIPFGWDLTDNKTLFAALFWGAAAILQRRGGAARTAVILAALATLVVFAIPHSTWGSEIRWETPAKRGEAPSERSVAVAGGNGPGRQLVAPARELSARLQKRQDGVESEAVAVAVPVNGLRAEGAMRRFAESLDGRPSAHPGQKGDQLVTEDRIARSGEGIHGRRG